MKVITWNVNGVRTRLPRLLALIERHQPDILCLQETKTPDRLFPVADIEAQGYRTAHFGQKSYNGVAILTRGGEASSVLNGFPDSPLPEQARVISAAYRGLTVVNLYVVNGQDLKSEAYPQKLLWLDRLIPWVEKLLSRGEPLLLCGDFNIAPDDRDVYDPAIWHDRVLVSEPERERFRTLLGLGLADLLRQHHPEGGIFSWWDYRQGALHRGWGLRLDLMLGSEAVVARCSAVEVDREERKATSGVGKPSDHAPVIATLDWPA